MSEARDQFFELLAPKIEEKGYTFKKSKKNFILEEGNIISTIDFNWDGRGGTTYLNHVCGIIYIDYINKALKTILNYKHHYPLFFTNGKGTIFDKRIPQMYSLELINLANDMAFKKMAAMPFEEKYPTKKIENCANRVTEIITTEVIPINESMNSEQKILDFKIESALAKLNEMDTHNTMYEILIIKIMCKKMKINEPQFITDINAFTNKSIDDLWNMQEFEFDKMEERFNNLKF